MLNAALLTVERLAAALIAGGGVAMAVCFRPLVLQALSSRAEPGFASTIENISIGAWSQYNRLAFLSALVAAGTDVIRMSMGMTVSASRFGLIIGIWLLLLGKFAVDRKLRARLRRYGDQAVASAEQKNGHRQVELLSIAILILAILAIVWPQ
ncbi:MAG: hypothetical protein ACYCVB_16640 [Bacilli bacterium]